MFPDIGTSAVGAEQIPRSECSLADDCGDWLRFPPGSGIRALRSRGGFVSFRAMAFIRLMLLALATCLLWTGCPPADRKADETKDKWYVLGESRQNSMDYKGAVEAFLKALETNPHSASAHKKLGILYDREEEVRDYWAAIYHYRRLLALRPDDQHADIIKDAIQNCQQELAGDVGPIAVDQVTARILEERDALGQELTKLREENRKLTEALAQAGGGGGGVNLPVLNGAGGGQPSQPPRPEPTVMPRQPSEAPALPRAGAANPGTATRPTTHVVQQGENLYRIATRYGLKAEDLQRANPHVNARTMRVGTILKIPPAR